MREEFEKLPHILELMQYVVCFDGLKYVSENQRTADYLNGAWYAFQEQQKNIDDVFLENAKLKHVIDQVKLHNGSLGFRSMQRMIEELLK